MYKDWIKISYDIYRVCKLCYKVHQHTYAPSFILLYNVYKWKNYIQSFNLYNKKKISKINEDYVLVPYD